MTNAEFNKKFRKRLLNFSINVLKFIGTLPYKKEYEVLGYQLSKSATSIGANYEESQNSSYKEFVQKIKIALREANETKYWLSIIENLEIGNQRDFKLLKSEINEIFLLLGSIAAKSKKKAQVQGR